VGRVQVETESRRVRGARGLWVVAAAAVALAAGSGCAMCKTPPPFFVSVQADADANAGAATRVLVLQLKSRDALESADFNEVRKDPKGALAETLVGTPEEIWVNAKEVETRWVARDKDARYVTAVAVYQNPGQHWWALHKMQRVSGLQCREVPVESFAGRKPYSSEEQMRFYLGRQDVTTDEAAPPADQDKDKDQPQSARPRGERSRSGA
jgi:type VI secretion system VasD/TssJ family lipoprotein